MTSTFRLTLDTHAPSVVWGGASGTTAGELLRVAYVSDEPLEYAALILGDGRRLTLTVLPDHVEVLLPPDAPDGWAAIEVRDDVDNRRTYANVVQLAGIGQPPAPEVVSSPGFPGPRSRPARARGPAAPEPRTVVLTSETRISTTSAVSTSTVVESAPAVSSTTASTAARRTISSGAEVATAVLIRVRRVVTSDSGRRLEREAIVRRRDSPDTELLLLLS